MGRIVVLNVLQLLHSQCQYSAVSKISFVVSPTYVSKRPLLTMGSVSRRLMSKFLNRRSHFRHLGPVLAGFESGSKGGNGGNPLRGINTADCYVELLAVWGLSGA